MILAGSWGTAHGQILGSSAVKPSDKPPTLPNEHLKNGVPSMFGKGGTNQFNTPVGPAGSRANVFNGPAAGAIGRPAPVSQAPSFWQKFKNFFGFGDPQAPGTVPTQIPPGSVDPRVFGGR